LIIDIIIANRRDLRPKHHMAFLAEYWREAGHTVRVVEVLSDDRPGDVGILHIDLTIIPDQIVAWGDRYAVLVNRKLRDISKRAISQHLVSRDDDYSSAVIVKTNLNRGGKPELRRKRFWFLREPYAVLRREVARRGDWRVARALPPNDYPVLPSKQDVPEWVWQDPDLVVEKFLPERVDGLFASRIWVFLGDRSYGRLELSTSPTGRGTRAVERHYTFEIPEELQAFRTNHEMEFGKIDWVLTENGPVIFDANRTPSRVTVPVGVDRDVMVGLSKGILAFAH
jgi:hypothetical protein